MKILAIDTSATSASVAVAEENKIIGESFINTKITHSQTLMPMIKELLKNTQINMKDIDAIAVNAGPGSFTGVRIGVAAAKGLAFADNKPCISVSTLYSMAFNMIDTDCIVCAVMDARCSQVYNALFKCSGGNIERLTDDRALSLDELSNDLTKYNEKVFLVGDGAEISNKYFEEKLKNIQIVNFCNRIQKATSVAYAAFSLYKQGQTITPEELMPTYLRLPQAQRELNKKMGVK